MRLFDRFRRRLPLWGPPTPGATLWEAPLGTIGPGESATVTLPFAVSPEGVVSIHGGPEDGHVFPPGRYRFVLTLSAQNAAPVRQRMELRVLDQPPFALLRLEGDPDDR